MKVQLYTAAILFACTKCGEEILLLRAREDEQAKAIIAAWPKWLGWFRPRFEPSTIHANQAAIVGRLAAIARHHKPGSMLMVEDGYLDAIAIFLAPSEAYADGDDVGRI